MALRMADDFGLIPLYNCDIPKTIAQELVEWYEIAGDADIDNWWEDSAWYMLQEKDYCEGYMPAIINLVCDYLNEGIYPKDASDDRMDLGSRERNGYVNYYKED